MGAMARYCTKISYAAATTAAACPELPYGDFAAGTVHIPAGNAMVTLTWYTAEKLGGTFMPAYDSSAAAVTQTVVHTRSYPIPAALAGAAALKVTANVAGTLEISMKG